MPSQRAIPVLVATLRRNAWNADGTAYDAYHDHPIVTRQLAADLNTPLIDLDGMEKTLMEPLGQAYTTRFWYNNYVRGEYSNYPNGNSDDVHFQEMGAIEMARLVTQSITNQPSDPYLSKLIPYIKPMHKITVTANIPSAGIITRTASYPQGLTITLKALTNSGHTFLNWKE